MGASEAATLYVGRLLPPAAGWHVSWGEWAGWRQRRLPAPLLPSDWRLAGPVPAGLGPSLRLPKP